MKTLITGGAGFIGSHLTEKLLSLDHEVVVIDDLSTGQRKNLEGFYSHPKFHFVLDTVRNPQTMHLLIQQADVIFHLAAAVGVQLIVDEPVRTIETNIHGTEVVLSIANKFRKKVFLASTSEVYGKSEKVPFHEDDDTILGSTRFSRWSYACSKAIDEFLGLAYFEQYGLPVVIGRYFNTVGPRQTGQYGMVIPRFIERALQNEPLLIYGTGQQRRCFTNVQDVVDATIALMACDAAPGRVYNIGSTEEISIEELGDKIIQMTESHSEKHFLSYEQAYGKPFDDMMQRTPCLKRIEQIIGYKPHFSLEQTLQIIIKNAQTQRKT
ncbi:MAG: GDP-mannose 4,6-dehydratase [Sedimentisphaerales bacterium]|nr:GDP-mannose 4,6-dehydratase [Sedimentisphaerales bacterium]